MKRKIYKLLSSAKQGLFALALILFWGTTYSQTTYTFNYTGTVQTISLPAGSYSIVCWGADGGTNLSNSGTLPGKGGYSSGTITLSSATTYSIYVGGKGNGGVQPLGGFNSGNSTTKTNLTGATGGGGASDVRVLVDDFYHRIIVGGGGGGQGNTTGTGGNGGGLIGQNGQGSTNFGIGGTQTLPGAYPPGGDSKLAAFGEGSDGPAGTTGGQGGGGWYGGSFGTRTNGGGAGGSGYVLTASSFTPTGYFSANANYYFNNAVTLRADESGFVTNPDLTGNGTVLITELCSVKVYASGSNSLNPAICSGNSLTLTTTAVSNYTWSNGNTTNTMIVVSPTVSQTYSVIGTSSAACQSSGLISVTVNSVSPVLTITNTPNSICLGKTATLTASGALSYTWAGGPGGIINGQTFTPTATSNYTVTGQNGCGTTTSVTTITIAPLVVSASANSTLVCSGTTATLTASSAVTGYTWFPVAVPGISVVVAPTVNTVYTVVASDGTCAGVATVSVNTKPNPTLTIAASNQTVCEGAVVTMTASGALSYTWTSPASNAPNISDNPTAPTLYQVSGTNSGNCVSSTSQIIFTDPTPTIAITSNKTIVCSGDPVTLTASGATTYNWTGGPPTAGNVVNPTGNTTYTASGTTGNCTGSQTITINVLTASVAASVVTPSVCNGTSTDLHATGATSYVWVGLSSFNGNVTVTPSVTTVYIVNATTTAAGLSCPSSSNITVTVFNNPTVTIAATKTVVCKSDPNIVLTAGGATTYTWSTATVSTNISVHPQSTITYTITGVDANGCMNTASQLIQVNTCSGIAELTDEKNSISIYPNPNNGTFMLKSDAAMDLILVNELGQHLRSLKLQESANFSVEVKDLKPGIYFIVNEKGSGTAVQKIVVN